MSVEKQFVEKFKTIHEKYVKQKNVAPSARFIWLGKILAHSFKKFGSLSLPQFAVRFISLSLKLTGLARKVCRPGLLSIQDENLMPDEWDRIHHRGELPCESGYCWGLGNPEKCCSMQVFQFHDFPTAAETVM